MPVFDWFHSKTIPLPRLGKLFPNLIVFVFHQTGFLDMKTFYVECREDILDILRFLKRFPSQHTNNQTRQVGVVTGSKPTCSKQHLLLAKINHVMFTRYKFYYKSKGSIVLPHPRLESRITQLFFKGKYSTTYQQPNQVGRSRVLGKGIARYATSLCDKKEVTYR